MDNEAHILENLNRKKLVLIQNVFIECICDILLQIWGGGFTDLRSKYPPRFHKFIIRTFFLYILAITL
jgi:hypothetical protein